MDKLCKHCGLESDREDLCSWCGKPLAEAAPDAKPPISEAPSRAELEPPPEGRRPGPHEGAAAAMMAAEAAKRTLPAWVYWAAAVGFLILLAVVASGIGVFLACRPLAEPEEWESVQSETNKISFQAPAGWKFSTSGLEAMFDKASVRRGKLYLVRIEGSQVKGILGDISGAASRASAPAEGAGPPPLDKRAEGRLHMMLGDFETKRDPNYEEVGEMQACAVSGMPAAYSQYTTVKKVGIFSVKVKGWRITVPAGEFSYDLRAEAPAKRWEAFEPIATHIFESVQLSR